MNNSKSYRIRIFVELHTDTDEQDSVEVYRASAQVDGFADAYDAKSADLSGALNVLQENAFFQQRKANQEQYD